MKKSFILVLLISFAACTVKLIPPTQSDVDRVSTKYPGYNLTELNEGKTLFEQTCTRCHRLKNPASKNEAKWTEIVPTMINKLNKKEGKIVINDKQQESILRYVITMNSARKSTM
jgi:cytochrome c5